MAGGIGLRRVDEDQPSFSSDSDAAAKVRRVDGVDIFGNRVMNAVARFA